MVLIEWNDSFSVQIEEIDDQHQMLVSMINDLHEAMIRRQGDQILADIIEGLIEYTVTHFKTEEKYFHQYGYADTREHLKEHAAFVQAVSEFKQGLDAGKLFLSIEVLNYLSNWLQNHIKKTDMQYVPFFKSKGLV